MKTTGAIRRIDDLGRIVIPKDVRRTLQISEGTPMEIYTLPDGIVLKKYRPETELLEIMQYFDNAMLSSEDLDADKALLLRRHLRDIRKILETEKELGVERKKHRWIPVGGEASRRSRRVCTRSGEWQALPEHYS